MVWPFGKRGRKEEKIQQLPELPELPPLPKTLEPRSLEFSRLQTRKPEKLRIKDELPPLPSFPTSVIGEKINNEAVKRAVKEPSIPALPRLSRTKEIEEETEEKKIREIKPSVKAEPVFVRIDRYQKALANFQEIKKKFLEIENLLKEIREVKIREETQLQSWEQEIEEAKAKLESIDKTLFSKLEE